LGKATGRLIMIPYHSATGPPDGIFGSLNFHRPFLSGNPAGCPCVEELLEKVDTRAQGKAPRLLNLPWSHMTESEKRQPPDEALTGPALRAPAVGVAEPRQWKQWDFMDSLGDGIYGIDPAGRCTFVNRAALEMLGYAFVQELLGRNMHDLIHHTRPDGSPYPKSDCLLLQALASGCPVRLDNEVLWCKDGTGVSKTWGSLLALGGLIGLADV